MAIKRLQNIAYRISLSWWMFLIPSLAALAIAALTVNVHAVRAAIANPVKGLKCE
ncbi:hypothetical protein KAR48_18460 [bacterium]|nr:hypothetical protein [bacterium]